MPQELSDWYRDNFNKLSAGPEDDVWKNISSRLAASSSRQKSERRRVGFVLIWLAFAVLLIGSLVLYRRSGRPVAEKFNQKALGNYFAEHTINPDSYGPQWIRTRALSFFPPPLTISCMGQRIDYYCHREGGGSAITLSEIAEQPLNPVLPTNKHDQPNSLAGLLVANILNSNTDANDGPGSSRVNQRNFVSEIPVAHRKPFILNSALRPVGPQNLLPETAATMTAQHHNQWWSQFYIGIYGAVRNSFLLNNQTYAGLSRHGFDQTHFVFTPGFGFNCGYRFSPSFSLESQFGIRDQFSQRYSVYREGLSHKQTYALSGYSAGLTARIFSAVILNRNLYFLAGAQCVFVRSLVYIDTRYEAIEQSLRRTSPLLIVGAEQELWSSGNLSLSIGLRARIGFWEVVRDEEVNYSGPPDTRLSDLGIYLSLQRSVAPGWK